MSLNSVILAVEDRLSDAISTKILENFDIGIMLRIGFKGNSYLQQKAPSLNQTARGPYNVFMLTDLDSPQNCPPQLIQSWISAPLNSGFFLRVAVMEVESWIMADRSALAKFLSIPVHRIPSNTDDIPNPKEFLVSLARGSNRRRLRDQLAPAPGATTAKVGPEYNSRFGEFIQVHWDLERAAVASPSLKRTLDRIRSAQAVSDNS